MPKAKRSPDILGLKRSIYGWSAFTVLLLLGLYVWAHWPAGV